MFKHFVLTRYNLYLYQSNPYKVEDKDFWMETRVPMFKRFVDSLENQTVTNFTLVLSIDLETPAKYYKEVLAILDKTSVDYVIQFDEKPKYYVQNNPIEEEWVITSRCDSDDTLEPEFIETIQRNFNQEEECLDVRGMQHDGKDFYTYNRKQVGSPFVTVIERTDGEIKTAAYKKHNEMRRHFFNRFVGIKPLFIQHIHNHNIINSIHGEKI